MKLRLIPNAVRQFKRLWSIRVALAWGVVAGLYMALPAFTDVLPPRVFAGACVLASVAMVVARMTKQKGIE